MKNTLNRPLRMEFSRKGIRITNPIALFGGLAAVTFAFVGEPLSAGLVALLTKKLGDWLG